VWPRAAGICPPTLTLPVRTERRPRSPHGQMLRLNAERCGQNRAGGVGGVAVRGFSKAVSAAAPQRQDPLLDLPALTF